MKSGKKDDISIIAKYDIDLHRYKNNILTALFNSGVLQAKVASMMFRYKVCKDTQLHDDCIQVLFLELAKKEPQYIIDRYVKDPTILVGLAVRILVWKVFAKPKNEAIKNHSLIHTLYTFSNLGNSLQTDEYDIMECLIDPYSDNDSDDYFDNFYDDLFDKINNNLSIKSKDSLKIYKEQMNKLPKGKRDFDIIFFKKKTNKQDLIDMIHEIINLNKNDQKIIMNKKEILIEIENIKPLLDEYLKTKNIKHLDFEKIDQVKKVWRMVNPASNANSLSSCGSCLKDSLDILISFYDRLKRQLAKDESNTPAENVHKITFENPPTEITKEQAIEALEEAKKEREVMRKTARKSKRNNA